MSITNLDVVTAFARRERAQARNLSTDGETLTSYGWYTLARWYGDEVVIRSGKLYSATASKHRNLAINALAFRVLWSYSTVETPREQGEMNIPGCEKGESYEETQRE